MTQRLMLMVMIGLMGVFLAACGATATPTPTLAEPSPATPATPMGEMSGMEHSMSDTGANQPYDAMFIDSMIEHHQGAIDMARQAQNEAEKIEIKTLAEAIIKAQEAEITQMKTWRQAWYPDLPSTGGMNGNGDNDD